MAANDQSNQIGRFYLASTSEIQSVRERRLEPKTREQTKWGTSVFTAWLQERGHSSQFECLSPE